MESVRHPITSEQGMELLRGWAPLAEVLEELRSVEDPLWLVGGAVRDLLRGVTPDEIDLVVEGDPAPIALLLAEGSRGARVDAHERFMTATVTGRGTPIDIAGARTETYSCPGALPDVVPASISDDLARRDFSVNAMAIALNGDSAGQLLDPLAGYEDLVKGRLRVLHDESFVDDPTRLWRLARYRWRLGYGVDPLSRELADSAVDSNATSTVAPERIGTEFRRVLGEARPDMALDVAREMGLLSPLGATGARFDAVPAAAELLGEQSALPDLAVAACWYGASPGRDAAGRIGLGRRLISLAMHAGRADELASRLDEASDSAEIDAVVRGVPDAVTALVAIAHESHNARNWIETIRGVKLPISGSDLIGRGVPEGPLIGVGLSAARRVALNEATTDRERLLECAVLAATGDPPDQADKSP